MAGAGAITASSLVGQQLPDARCIPLVRCRQQQQRRRIPCASATDRLAEVFTLAVKTAGPSTPSVPLPEASTFSPPPLPSAPISGPSAAAAVDSAVTNAIDLIKAAGSLAKSGLDSAGVGAGYAKEAYGKVSPVLSEAATTASPYVKAAAKTAGDVAAPALEALKPVLQGALGEVDSFLYSKGLNSSAFLSSAKDAQSKASGAIDTASPSVNSALTTVRSTNPTILAEYALGLVALYYLGPPILRLVFGGLRGYRGNISPAAALDAASKEGNTVIVDIRSEREKGNAGVPDLPFGGRVVECEYASVSDRRLRGQLRNPGDIERQVTVLEIASLKRVGKGTKILLLDSNGSTSKRIAKDLTRRGFRNVLVIEGGFGGWNSQKLQTKYSSSVSPTEILAPFFGGTERRSSPSGGARRALPSGR